jgi:threonine/homoserine/homoserine lactone efflux protein
MKAAFYRFIAIMMLVIPGLAATYGFLAMKDAFFAQFGPPENDPHVQWGKLLLGLVLFLAGVAFIAGWIFFRDRKRNYVAPRFKAKRAKRRGE